jgi:hypothetical protein
MGHPLSSLYDDATIGLQDYRTGDPPALHQPQVNFEELGPQEEAPELSELFEELKLERILSGFFAPQ